MVDADPIRMILYRWMIETGDPIDVVGHGFQVDPQLLRDILDRTTRALPRGDWNHVACRLGVRSDAKH